MLLLLFTVAIRWPTFDARFFPTDESLYLVIGERLAEGAVLYRDAWDNKPPLLLWFYGLNTLVFGKNAVWAVRLWACVILAWSAVRFYRLIENYKFVYRRDAAFCTLFVASFSVPWYSAELNAELFILPMAVEAIRLLARYGIDEKRSWEHLFFVGVLCGASFFSKYQALHLALIVAVALWLISTPTAADWTTLAGGFAFVALLTLSYLYACGAWTDFWDVGVAYNLDYLRLSGNPGDDPKGDQWTEYFKIWGLPMIAALAGVWTFRAGFYNLPIRQRKFGSLMTLWLLFSLVPLFLGRVYLHYFWFVLSPMLFWAALLIFGRIGRTHPKTAGLLWTSLWAVPLATWMLYFIVSDNERFDRLRSWFRPKGWV
ncbi:MAG: glycosyltransferase family 39 protein, partial [Bacteroidia bacterium]|nr:glycosyltransferase family 39 protein [Bacteroidia bacterium]